ncbi:MAG: hypothetical protein WC648_03945 [Candidatus Paceibacterota bacterium]|jgi:hypothetical protein
MASIGNKAKGGGWLILYIITGVVDIFQIFATATGVGIVASEALEAIMPFVLAGTLQFLLKVSLISHPSRLLSIIGATGFDALTGGVAPFWILDVWYVQRTVKSEDTEVLSEMNKEAFMKQNIAQPLYSNGRRNVTTSNIENTENQSRPVVMDGVRAPGGGLNR